jgi:hypothetical protein
MKNYKNIALLVGLVYCTLSCTEYLAVVPDNTLKLENIFSMKEDAYNALAKVYYYLPYDNRTHDTRWLLGDDWVGRQDPDVTNGTGYLHGIRIMRGLQSATSPQLNFWEGGNGGRNLYLAISSANVFLDNIGNVHNMSSGEIAEWSAQVKFLKAYYHFILLQHYGPIIIQDKVIPPDALSTDLFQRRNKVEEVFDYILKLMDEAIPDLKLVTPDVDAGMLNQMGAKALKARVLLYRASPFYNGNKEYFGDFLDHDGQPYFSMEKDPNKWKVALEAVEDAIQTCEANGKKLYEYTGNPFLYDTAAFRLNGERMQKLYNCRMLICDPWNDELVWGYSNPAMASYGQDDISSSSNIRLPSGYEGETNVASFSWQWMGSNYNVAERYYTENGLPIDEDNTFDVNTKHDIVVTPGVDEEEYAPLQGLMEAGAETINLYLGREMRFYANLGITGGFWRGHLYRIPTTFFQLGNGGYNSGINSTDFLWTGIGVQKFVHPENMSGAWQRVIPYPFPIVRMAELYLMRAECRLMAEGVSQAVYDDLNKIRRRAGVPDVEKAWSDATICKHPGQHLDADGLLDIILRESSIEYAFEGRHFWDMLRHRRAPQEFSAPTLGWNYQGQNASSFFVLSVMEQRRFSVQDCLWPISLNETNTNGELIQNPGW